MADDVTVTEPVEEVVEETPTPPETTPAVDAPSQEPSEPTEPAAEPEPPEDEPAAEEQPKTRKERRAERQRYMDSIRNEGATPVAPQTAEEYHPRDYNELVTEDGLLDTQAAIADREAFAKNEAQKVARREQFKSQQEKFRQSVELEKQMVEAEYSFAKEDSPDFDPELVESINDRFLAVVGYREVPVTNQVTGQVTTQWVADRPDVSYKKFFKNEMAHLERYAEERSDQTARNVASSKATQGTRPSGRTAKVDITDPNVIAKMSAEEFKKHEAEIMAHAASLPPK